MTDISPVSPLAGPNLAPPPPTNTADKLISSDFNTFLKMLTTQLKNQDPLNPMDNSEYAVQLATFSGVEQQVKTNTLLESLGAQLFDSKISIIDDPHRMRGLGSRAFDGEGLPTTRRYIIEKGALTGWLMESASARQLGLEPTGHASRGISGAPSVSPSNVHLEGGSVSVTELIADIKHGVYIHELAGQGVNPVTGDYSRGAAGFLIINGEIAGPVSEFTIAGNLKDMFAAMTAANDLEFTRSMNVPTLRIDGMMIAGA